MNTTIALWTRAFKSWLPACLLTAMLMAPPSSRPAAAQGISFSSVSGDGANIFSPTYIVPKGIFLDTLTYHHYDETADVFDSQGAKRDSIEITSQSVNEAIAYGITDRFDVQVGMGNYPEFRTKTTGLTGNTTTTNASGVTDPTIAAAYRLQSQNYRHPVNWDIEAAYSPNAFDKK